MNLMATIAGLIRHEQTETTGAAAGTGSALGEFELRQRYL